MRRKDAEAVALLAPVPLVHLEDGVETCAREGKVAFGSRAYDTFVKLDAIRQGEPIDVYLDASHAHEDGPIRVSSTGRYVGYVGSKNGAHPEGMKFRPPSTLDDPSDNHGHWYVFWEVTDLRWLEGDEQILVRDMRGWQHKTRYSRFFVPEGPLIIEQP